MLAVVVLAAGRGVRLRSERAKVRHEVAGRSLLRWVLEAVRPLGADRVVVVVGHQAEEVAADAAAAALPGLGVVVQAEQRGTGHAVATAFAAGVLDDADAVAGPPRRRPGADARGARRAPRRAALRRAWRWPPPRPPTRTATAASCATRPGRSPAIVEDRDATPEQRTVREVNAGVYAFPAQPLRAALDQLPSDNAQGEQYLTDVVARLVAELPVVAVHADPATLAGVNDRVQLAAADAELRGRTLQRLMRDGRHGRGPRSDLRRRRRRGRPGHRAAARHDPGRRHAHRQRRDDRPRARG